MRNSLLVKIGVGLLLFSLAGCGSSGTSTSGGTGSIVAQLEWSQGKINSTLGTVGIHSASAPSSVVTVRILVTGPDMADIQKDFPASAGTGVIGGIPAGSNRTLTAQGLDASGLVTHQGVKNNITVQPGQTTDAGTVVMNPVGDTFTVSGRVTLNGSGLPGVTVSLQGTSFSTVTGSDGTYTLSGVPNASYTVIPSMTGYTFTPATRSVPDSNGSVTGQDFTVALDVSAYTVGVNPYALAIDASGNVWVTNAGSNSVTKLSTSGTVLGTFPLPVSGHFPQGIAIDATGNVWVTSTANAGAGYTLGTVTKLSPSGAILNSYQLGFGLSRVAIDPSGNVWVLDGSSNHTLIKLSSSGALLGTFTIVSQLNDFAIDASGNVWVANQSNDVIKLNPSGTVVGTYPVGSDQFGIAIDLSGNVWVTSVGGQNIIKLTPGGTVITTHGLVGSTPYDVAIDPSGNVWVPDYALNSVNVWRGAATGPQFWPYSGPVWP